MKPITKKDFAKASDRVDNWLKYIWEHSDDMSKMLPTTVSHLSKEITNPDDFGTIASLVLTILQLHHTTSILDRKCPSKILKEMEDAFDKVKTFMECITADYILGMERTENETTN